MSISLLLEKLALRVRPLPKGLTWPNWSSSCPFSDPRVEGSALGWVQDSFQPHPPEAGLGLQNGEEKGEQRAAKALKGN